MKDTLTTIIPIGNLNKDLSNLLNIRKLAIKNRVKVIFVLDDKGVKNHHEAVKILKQEAEECIEVLIFGGKNPGGARNMGLNSAISEWVHFCDSDDEPDFAEMMRIISDYSMPKADIYVCNYRIVSSKGGLIQRSGKTRNLFDVAMNPGLWRWVIKRNCLVGMEFPEGRLGEDQVFIARFLSGNPKVQLLGKREIYSYFVNDQHSLTRELDLNSLKMSIEAFKRIELSSYSLRWRVFVFIMFSRLIFTLVNNSREQKQISKIVSIFSWFIQALNYARKIFRFRTKEL